MTLLEVIESDIPSLLDANVKFEKDFRLSSREGVN